MPVNLINTKSAPPVTYLMQLHMVYHQQIEITINTHKCKMLLIILKIRI